MFQERICQCQSFPTYCTAIVLCTRLLLSIASINWTSYHTPLDSIRMKPPKPGLFHAPYKICKYFCIGERILTLCFKLPRNNKGCYDKSAMNKE